MSDRQHSNDESLMPQVRAALDSQTEELDTNTLARLHAARRLAIAELEARAQRRAQRTAWWVPAGAFATVAMAAAVYTLWNGSSISPPDAEFADIQMSAEADDLEIVEDLEFYEWLDTTNATAG